MAADQDIFGPCAINCGTYDMAGMVGVCDVYDSHDIAIHCGFFLVL